MKITKELKALTRDELGVNILDGILPEVKRLDGVEKELTIRIASPIMDPNYIAYIAEDSMFSTHIDIDGTAFSLLYDLGEEQEIEKIYFACYSTPYAIGEVEVYASNNKEDIFDAKNRIIEIDNRNDDALFKVHKQQAVLFNTEDLSCKYVGFIQKSTNAPDDISRLRNFGIYNKKYTKSRLFIRDNYEGSCIQGKLPEVKGEYEGNLAWLTDAAAFGGEKALVVKDAEIKYELPFTKKIDELIIIGEDLKDLMICDDSGAFKKVDYSEETTSVGTLYKIDVSGFKITKTITLKLSGNLDEILIFCRSLDIKVNWDEVITKDFLGLGANALPCHLFEMGRMAGFTDAHLQLEKRRLSVAKPSIVRLWFQIDWFIMDEEDYYNRKYVFNTPKMKAVFKELDMFKELGIEVEFNFGWKVGYSAVDWFCFDVFNKRNSAPRDLDQYAIACVDCLRELIINRGYDNIKYLSFYNESNNGLYDTGWDFVCPRGVHPMDYWLEMMKKVHARLKQEGMEGIVDIWAAEIVGQWKKWAEFYNTNAPDLYTHFSFHQYHASYTNAIEWNKDLKQYAGDRPISVTEFATYDADDYKPEDFSFECNNIATILGYINVGMSSLHFWILSGSVVDEGFVINHDQGNFWSMPTNDKPVSVASKHYYPMAMVTNYIPMHSTVYRTEWKDNGIHSTAVKTADGHITVAVELKETIKPKHLNIDLGEHVGRKFYKHIYTLDTEREANIIVAPVAAELDVDDVISDEIDSKYCFIIYTTMPPIRQVVMDEVFTQTKFGEPLKLGAKVIDGEGEIKWSIVDCNRTYYLEAEVSQDGVFKTSDEYFSTTVGLPTFAVKAELPTGEYGITIVKVTK